MWGRFYAVAIAVLFVLPLVLVLDTALRPRAAWARVGRSKWRWVATFAFAPLVSLLARSFLPAIAIVPFSAFYLAKVRSVLEVATGLVATERGRTPRTLPQQAALEPLYITVPPILVFLGIVLWTGDTRGRVVAAVMATAALTGVGVSVWRTRQPPR